MAREVHIQIRTENCQVCQRCLAAEICKVRAILRIDSDEPPYIDVERCYDCRLCVFACPYEAIALASVIALANNKIEV